MPSPRLFLNCDARFDWLIALEFGRTDEGQPSENWRPVSEDFAYLVEDSRCMGFVVLRRSEFDPYSDDVWDGPRFDVPVLGLRDVCAGEVILAAGSMLEGRSTINRHFFRRAIRASERPSEALIHWRACLQTGDVMAHYGLGYTLFALGRYHEAYRHLRAYAELAPLNAWAQCWYGKAAQAIGETGEAKEAYRLALELESDSDDETDAAELLEELLARESP